MQILISINSDKDADAYKALKETGFFGRRGAGALIYCRATNRYLLAHRSKHVLEPNTWGIWGGALHEGEDPREGVIREMHEELGIRLRHRPRLMYVFKKDAFEYYNFLISVNKEFEPRLNWETKGYGWFTKEDFPRNLHYGVKALIKNVELR